MNDVLSYLQRQEVEATPDNATNSNTTEPEAQVQPEVQPEPEVEGSVQEVTEEVKDNNQPAVDETKEVETVPAQTVEKPKVNEKLAELNSFLDRFPEKSVEDYLALKRPVSELNEDALIKDFLSKKEGKTDKEIQLALKELELKNVSEDDDFAEGIDEAEALKIEAKRERLLKDAQDWYSQVQKEAFESLTPTEASAEPSEALSVDQMKQRILDEGLAIQKKAQEDYYSKTYGALGELNSIDVEIAGERVSFGVDDSFKKLLREGLDVEKSAERFFDEKGSLKDPKGYIEELAWSDPTTRKSMIAFIEAQATERAIANQLKTRRNINLSAQSPTSGGSLDGIETEGIDSYFKDRFMNM